MPRLIQASEKSAAILMENAKCEKSKNLYKSGTYLDRAAFLVSGCRRSLKITYLC